MMLQTILAVLCTLVIVADFLLTLVDRKIKPFDVVVRGAMVLIWGYLITLMVW